jgi:predicted nucleic acid-binding protein
MIGGSRIGSCTVGSSDIEADRVIIATAREHGYRIMTRDRKILGYAEQGHVRAIAC